MKVLNAMQLKKGAKTKGPSVHASLTQPIQFVSAKEKDDLPTDNNKLFDDRFEGGKKEGNAASK